MMKQKLLLTLTLILFFIAPLAKADNTTTRFKVNREYGGIYMVAAPQEFEIWIPTTGVKTTYPPSLNSSETYVKFDFTTASDQIKENLFLSYIKIPLGDKEQRVTQTKELLTDKMNLLTNKTPQKYITHQIKNYDVVTALTEYNGFFLTLSAIINPKSHHCILSVVNINPSLSKAKTIDSILSLSETYQVLQSFKYGRELM